MFWQKFSGYPELSKLSQWCQTNLTDFVNTPSDDVKQFIATGECWAWLEHLGICLNEPEEPSNLSLLTAEIMREEWSHAFDITELQNIPRKIRKSETNEKEETPSKTLEEPTEKPKTDEVISWDEDIHPELLSTYFQETPDQIAEIAGLLHKISNKKANKADYKKASRIAHTVKGASGVVGLTSLVELTHSLEDILDYSVNNELPKDTAEFLAETSDCLESLFETIQNKQKAPEELAPVLEKLSTFAGELSYDRK
ncbi:Chemotaxis protein CheA [Nymphon striatum]|nr:Chemotaxis protein CheA [Nymphon striatum]